MTYDHLIALSMNPTSNPNEGAERQAVLSVELLSKIKPFLLSQERNFSDRTSMFKKDSKGDDYRISAHVDPHFPGTLKILVDYTGPGYTNADESRVIRYGFDGKRIFGSSERVPDAEVEKYLQELLDGNIAELRVDRDPETGEAIGEISGDVHKAFLDRFHGGQTK